MQLLAARPCLTKTHFLRVGSETYLLAAAFDMRQRHLLLAAIIEDDVELVPNFRQDFANCLQREFRTMLEYFILPVLAKTLLMAYGIDVGRNEDATR